MFDWDRHQFVVWTWGRLNVFHPSRVVAAERNVLGNLEIKLLTPKDRVIYTMSFERVRTSFGDRSRFSISVPSFAASVHFARRIRAPA